MNTFSHELLETLAAKAVASPRRRAHHNVHASSEDVVQRFFVVAEPETYFRPHRHHTRSELALVLRGRFEVVTFDDEARVTGRTMIGEGTDRFGYELPVATWHTLLVRAPGSAFFEVKEGPYDPSVAAEFAPWAPAEGTPEVAAMREWLGTARVGEQVPQLRASVL